MSRSQTTADNPLAPDDRVIYRDYGPPQHGTIVKLAKTKATVRMDASGKDVQILLRGLRRETPEDVVRRDREAAVHEWRSRQPSARLMSVIRDRWTNGEEAGVHVSICRTPEEMRHAARELQQLADWFEQRPAAP